MLRNTPANGDDADSQSNLRIFVPGFTKEQWGIVLDAWDDDRKKMTFEEQRATQASAVKALREDGNDVQEIPIDPHKMLSWIRKHGLKNDGRGRSRYYADVGRCRDQGVADPE